MARVSRRRAAAWLMSVPLMMAGSQVAHAFAFWLVYPQAQLRLRALVQTGHSYMLGRAAFLPLVLGALGGVELIVFAWTVVGVVRAQRHRSVPAWAFALLPLLGFSVQEFVERFLAGTPAPWLVVLEPTFRIGLLLQLPFGLVAFLLARLLLHVAEHVGQALRLSGPRERLGALPLRWSVRPFSLPRAPVLADGHAGRGPPFGIAGAALSALL